MPRRPDQPCASCGRLMYRGKGVLPPGQATCRDCRRKQPGYQRRTKSTWTPEERTCPVCGTDFRQTRYGQAYCDPTCRDQRHRSGTKTKTGDRGYGAQHQRKRKEWAPRVARGEVDCHAAVCLIELDGYDRRIEPGEPWDLGHTPDRSRWTGPEHRTCNRSEGATRGNQLRGGQQPVPSVPPRSWAL